VDAEFKAVQGLLPIHEAQVLTHLKFKRCPLGLLINFNVPILKDGVRRVVFGSVFQNCSELCVSVPLWLTLVEI